MVKTLVLFSVLFTSMLVDAQTDTLKCEEHFNYYDTLLGENLIFIWEANPILKNCFQKDVSNLKEFTKKHINQEHIVVSMIIDSEGIPICFRFFQNIESGIKSRIIDKLKLLRFEPAKQRGIGVESIYILQI